MKLKIGYVLKMYPRYSETFIVNEILAHEAAGIEIEIFSLRSPVDTHFQDIISRVRAPVTYLPSATPKIPDFWAALQRANQVTAGLPCMLDTAWGEEAGDVYQAVILAEMARQRGLDLLHAHFASASTTVASLAARLSGLPYTFTAHAKDIFHESVLPDDLRRKLATAAAVITVSDYNVAYLRETYGAAAAGVQRVYNGLDLSRFQYAPPHHRSPLIISVGRLVEKKGFPDLIDACAILARQGCDFHCQIVGTGPDETELRFRIAMLGLEDRVELLGPRPQAEVTGLIQAAAAFVAPCVIGADGNRDGLPTVLLEAIALGTPCVSTDVTGIPEVVHDGETGLIVPQHSPLAVATAVERLLEDSRLRVALAGQARQYIEECFDIRHNAAELRSIFQQVVGARTPAALEMA
jgi:colanic acid/amylovoran biosynthesis glycosyltransferase